MHNLIAKIKSYISEKQEYIEENGLIPSIAIIILLIGVPATILVGCALFN